MPKTGQLWDSFTLSMGNISEKEFSITANGYTDFNEKSDAIERHMHLLLRDVVNQSCKTGCIYMWWQFEEF